MTMAWSGPARRLSPGDVETAAARLGVPLAHLLAVLAVEARGSGFDAAGRPIILYEPHVFYRQLRARGPGKLIYAEAQGLAYASWGTQPYPRGQDAQYARLDAACAIDRECAVRACSWGMGQVLGENWQQAGYGSAVAMAEAFAQSEAEQLAAMLRLIQAWGLTGALATGDWARFARRYNGPGQVAKYAAMLAAAVKAARQARPAPLRPAPIPTPIPAPAPVTLPLPASPPPPVPRPAPQRPKVRVPARRDTRADDLNRDALEQAVTDRLNDEALERAQRGVG